MFPVLPGAAMAGEAVEISVAPVTAKGADAVRLPLVALTVITRFEGSAPIETIAAVVPLLPVVALAWVKVALLSTENVTGMPANAWPAAVVAVAVAVTVVAPALGMLAVLSCRVRLLAVELPPPLAPLAPPPKSEVPALLP